MVDEKELISILRKFVQERSGYITVYYNERIGLDIVTPAYKDLNNITRLIDSQIHNEYIGKIKSILKNDVYIIGEEKVIKKNEKQSWKTRW